MVDVGVALKKIKQWVGIMQGNRNDGREPPKSSSFVQLLGNVLVIMVFIVLATFVSSTFKNPKLGIAFVILGVLAVTYRIVKNSIADARQQTSHLKANNLPMPNAPWPPFPSVPPPLPPMNREQPMKALLPFLMPLILVLLVPVLIGGLNNAPTENFIPNPARYDAVQWMFVVAGAVGLLLLCLWVFKSIPYLFRHQTFLTSKANPGMRVRFNITATALVCVISLHYSSFPLGMLAYLHAQSPHTALAQDVVISDKYYSKEDDDYRIKAQMSDGKPETLYVPEAVYQQAWIGGHLHLIGTVSPYGTLVTDGSVLDPIVAAPAPTAPILASGAAS
jgi:hypothetical protein